jgi:hypothetical protein
VRARAADADTGLLPQVQAADVMSDLLTFTADRTAARVVNMGNYLKQINKLDAYDQFKPAGESAGKMDYTQVYAGAVHFIKTGGDKYADPSLSKMSDVQLRTELTALQTYDVREFAFLSQKRKLADRVKAFLVSIKEFDGYRKWSGDTSATPSTNPASSSLNAEQRVAHAENLMNADRATALARAKAKGVSQSDFDAQWAAKETQFKSEVAQRVEGIAALSSSLDQQSAAQATAAPPLSGAQINTPQTPAATDLTPFSDPYSDTFHTTYTGPGVYMNYDSRIDDDNDQRVNGEYDRRENLGFDRRENIQINVRKGV